MKKYQSEVLRNVQANYVAFREAELAKTTAEVFNDAYQINFMSFMSDFFDGDELLSGKTYAFLAKDKDRILDNLYGHYMRYWDRTISETDEALDLVNDYYNTYHSERGGEM